MCDLIKDRMLEGNHNVFLPVGFTPKEMQCKDQGFSLLVPLFKVGDYGYRSKTDFESGSNLRILFT